jgi:hypothetical protein
LVRAGDWFRQYYLEQRKAQIISALTDGMIRRHPFLDVYQPYLMQVVGHFAVEDLVMRTAKVRPLTLIPNPKP